MPKPWFVFLNDANKNAKRSLFTITLAMTVLSSSAFADDAETLILSLPEAQLKEVHKNDAGSQFQIGDRIRLYAELNADLNAELIRDQSELTVEVPKSGSKIEEQGWYIDPQTLLISNNLQFVVTPIRSGKITLPTLIITRVDKTPIARTAPFSIEVAAIQKKEKSSELLEPLDIALATKYWVYLALASIAVALASIYFIRRYLNSRTLVKPTSIPVIKKESEHDIAMRALDQLYKAYPYRTEHLKPVAFGVSEILKHFFSDRFQVDANEATTDEMIVLLRAESIPSDALREIAALFVDLDLIKFTKTNDYSYFNEQHYVEFKIKAQSIIQKWAKRVEVSPT